MLSERSVESRQGCEQDDFLLRLYPPSLLPLGKAGVNAQGFAVRTEGKIGV